MPQARRACTGWLSRSSAVDDLNTQLHQSLARRDHRAASLIGSNITRKVPLEVHASSGCTGSILNRSLPRFEGLPHPARACYLLNGAALRRLSAHSLLPNEGILP